MLSLMLVSALLAGPQGDAAASKPPVFHAEAYVVVSNPQLFVDHGHPSRLTADNFQAFVNKTPVAIDVSPDPHQLGLYLLSINPPDELRDGKSHQIHVQIRNWPKADDDTWKDIMRNWTAVFAKPRVARLGL